MNQSVKSDMSWSSLIFYNDVWPLVAKIVGGGQLLQMEGRPDQELATMLDMRAGIDGWQMTKKGGMRGVAARVQKGDKAWNTFTVRKSRRSGAETEYAKRHRAIEEKSGEIYPHLTIQAYALTELGPVISVGVARTADIISFIVLGLAIVRETSNADFYVCPWDKMKESGFKVGVYTKEESKS